MSESNNTLKNATVILVSLVTLVIAVGSILLAAGSVVGDIDQNKGDIVKLENITDIHTTEIVQGKLDRQKQAQTANNTLNVLTSLNNKLDNFDNKLDSMSETLNAQATDIALIQQAQNKGTK
jgi:hypothetical protein